MKEYLNRLANDYENALEKLVSADGVVGQKKITNKLVPGSPCAWCYEEDIEYWKKWGEGYLYPSKWPYQGFIIPFPDTDGRGEMDPEHVCVVVVDYPIEKENPVTDWGTLANLLATPTLHRFYVFAKIKLH